MSQTIPGYKSGAITIFLIIFLFPALREFDGSRHFNDLLCVFVEI